MTAKQAIELANENVDKYLPDLLEKIRLKATAGECELMHERISGVLKNKLKELGYDVVFNMRDAMSGHDVLIKWGEDHKDMPVLLP